MLPAMCYSATTSNDGPIADNGVEAIIRTGFPIVRGVYCQPAIFDLPITATPRCCVAANEVT